MTGSSTQNVYAIVSPLGGLITLATESHLDSWRQSDARQVAAGQFGYDILVIPALVVHRSSKRPLDV